MVFDARIESLGGGERGSERGAGGSLSTSCELAFVGISRWVRCRSDADVEDEHDGQRDGDQQEGGHAVSLAILAATRKASVAQSEKS